MSEYNLNDPVDVEIMRGKFDMYSHEDWDEYIEIAEERKIGSKNINILKSSCKRAGLAKFMTPKVLLWVLNLIDQLDEEEDEYEDDEEFDED